MAQITFSSTVIPLISFYIGKYNSFFFYSQAGKLEIYGLNLPQFYKLQYDGILTKT